MLMVAREVSAEEFKKIVSDKPQEATKEDIINEMDKIIDDIYEKMDKLDGLFNELKK